MTMPDHILRRRVNPWLACLISAAVLLGTLALAIERRAQILRDGREIVVKTEPVDPRDLMRGDYVRLGYPDLSAISRELFVGDWPDSDITTPVWLVLAPGDDGVFVTKSAHLVKPEEIAEGETVLKSRPIRISAAQPTGGVSPIERLEFGIERYYVPEGEGLEIEKAQNAGRTSVAVRVSGDGDPQIARLMIDGETLYQEPLY